MSPSEIDSLLSNLKKIPGELKMLIEKRIELYTIEVGERIADMIANALYRLIGIVFLSLGMILILFAAAKFTGELLGSESLGFVLVSAPMLLAGLLFFLRRPRSMVIRTRDSMVHQFMKDLLEQIHESDDENRKKNGGSAGENMSTDESKKSNT